MMSPLVQGVNVRNLTRQNIIFLTIGACIATTAVFVSNVGIHVTATPEFCMSCHEMRIVGEQGWMRSPHYRNPKGVVAGCKDCHIPPELVHMLWTKTRDGVKDIAVHLFGESDAKKMDWDHLRDMARAKVSDSACRTCHDNLTPKGAEIKTIIAHRAYQRLDGEKKCTDCHTKEFHGKFREYLFGVNNAYTQGGRP